MNTIIKIPFLEGLTLACEPGHEQNLNVVLAHLSCAIEAANRNRTSPLLSEYIQTVLLRFLRETPYSAKSAAMITSRFKKLASILISDNANKKVAELNEHEARRVKADLPALLRKNSLSSSQGSNVEAYYRLFNRIVKEALNDNYIPTSFKIQATRTKKSQISKPFSDADLTALFTGWPYLADGKINFDAHPYRFWLMPLSLFTGGRLNELCQLRVHDIVKDVHGIDLVSFNDHGHYKSLKNDQSRRQVPLHPALKRMGFLDFVEQQRHALGEDGLLFPELTFHPTHLYSRGPSRFFCGPQTGAGYIGQHCPHTKEGGWSFKSFRRTFALRLEASGIPRSTIAYLLGHRSGATDVTGKHYLSQPMSVCMLDQLELGLTYNLDLNGISWSKYKGVVVMQKQRSKRGRPVAPDTSEAKK